MGLCGKVIGIASSGMEVSPVLMVALDAIHVLLGPSEQRVVSTGATVLGIS